MSSYIRSSINFIMSNKEVYKNPEIVGDLFTLIRVMEESVKLWREPFEKYRNIIDLGLFSSLDKQTLKAVKSK